MEISAKTKEKDRNTNINVEEQKEETPKETLEKLAEYLMSEEFSDDCEEVSNKFNIPKKKVANSFATKCLGTIGDVLGIAFDTTGNVVTTLLRIIYNVLQSVIGIIVKVAKAIVGFITLNYTNKKVAIA